MPSRNVLNSAVFNPEIWGDMVLEFRKDNLNVADRVMRLDSMVAKKGDLIHLPRHSKQTARTKVPDTAITYDATTEGEFTVAITSHIYSARLIEDIEATQSAYDLMKLEAEGIGYTLSEKVETDLLGLYTTTAQTVGVVANSTTDRIAKTYLLRARRFLDLAKAPQRDRYIALDAYGLEQMFALDDFIRYDASGQSGASANGKLPLGKIYGIEVLQNGNLTPSVTSVARALIFQKDGIALAMQKDVTMRDEYSVDYIGTKVVGHMIYGYGAARTDHLVTLLYGIA
jgi:hypothetical protein